MSVVGNCPASCGTITILANPSSSCQDNIRRKTVSRFIFYPCSIQLPSPITNASMLALFTAGQLVFTSALGNIVPADPATEDIMVDECSTARKVITTRTITFEDRVAINNTTYSPSVQAPYFDYNFWQDKNNQQLQLNVMIAYCDGDVIIPQDGNGNPLKMSMLVFLSFQKPQNVGGAWVEFKKGEMTFRGDPFDMSTPPSWNYLTAGINP